MKKPKPCPRCGRECLSVVELNGVKMCVDCLPEALKEIAALFKRKEEEEK